jgi:hypothetical protein
MRSGAHRTTSFAKPPCVCSRLRVRVPSSDGARGVRSLAAISEKSFDPEALVTHVYRFPSHDPAEVACSAPLMRHRLSILPPRPPVPGVGCCPGVPKSVATPERNISPLCAVPGPSTLIGAGSPPARAAALLRRRTAAPPAELTACGARRVFPEESDVSFDPDRMGFLAPSAEESLDPDRERVMPITSEMSFDPERCAPPAGLGAWFRLCPPGPR